MEMVTLGLYTRADVAKLFAVSSNTVWRWTRDGHLPVVKMTDISRLRYRWEDIKALYQAMCLGRIPPDRGRWAYGPTRREAVISARVRREMAELAKRRAANPRISPLPSPRLIRHDAAHLRPGVTVQSTHEAAGAAPGDTGSIIRWVGESVMVQWSDDRLTVASIDDVRVTDKPGAEVKTKDGSESKEPR